MFDAVKEVYTRLGYFGQVMSYHDIEVFIDGVRYCPSRNYALSLVCSKATGWRLYYEWQGTQKLLGGEFDGHDMCIAAADQVILGKRPTEFTEWQGGGWTGQIVAGGNSNE